MTPSSQIDAEYRFADFSFAPVRQSLTRAGQPVRVGSRAMAILHLLIERRATLVTKEDIFDRVWPRRQVEEDNIKIHVAALRRALGDGPTEWRYIVTEPGRGYRFIAPLLVPHSKTRMVAAEPSDTLPVRLTSIVGRDESISQVVALLAANRLVTLVGGGGIGKTTVAVAAARRAAAVHPDGVVLIDLAPLTAPEFVLATIASQLGVPHRAQGPERALLEFFAQRKLLMVLDNCEHLLEACRQLAESVLAAAPGVHILATSREALAVPAERVYPLAPLEISRAVQLFIERAAARLPDFEPNDTEVQGITEICRRLDNVPLAIELAAAVVDTFGVSGIAAALDNRFSVLTRGYRTSAPRQRTLRGVMDWSHDLLPERCQAVLRRLSVFRGSFTLEAAEEIATCARIESWEVVEHLTSLTEKSLVACSADHSPREFKLLETVRVYAAEKLVASGELDLSMERLAERCRQVFGQAVDVSTIGITPARRTIYLRQVDDLRASLKWALSSEQHSGTGAELAIAATPALDSLGLFMEAYQVLRSAIDTTEKANPASKQNLMQLYALMAPMCMWITLEGSEGERSCRRLLELAHDSNRVDFQLVALRSLFYVGILSGQNALARDYSVQMAEVGLAAGDEDACVVCAAKSGGNALHHGRARGRIANL